MFFPLFDFLYKSLTHRLVAFYSVSSRVSLGALQVLLSVHHLNIGFLLLILWQTCIVLLQVPNFRLIIVRVTAQLISFFLKDLHLSLWRVLDLITYSLLLSMTLLCICRVIQASHVKLNLWILLFISDWQVSCIRLLSRVLLLNAQLVFRFSFLCAWPLYFFFSNLILYSSWAILFNSGINVLRWVLLWDARDLGLASMSMKRRRKSTWPMKLWDQSKFSCCLWFFYHLRILLEDSYLLIHWLVSSYLRSSTLIRRVVHEDFWN